VHFFPRGPAPLSRDVFERLVGAAPKVPGDGTLRALAGALALIDTPWPVPQLRECLGDCESPIEAYVAFAAGDTRKSVGALGAAFAHADDRTWSLLRSEKLRSVPGWDAFLLGLRSALGPDSDRQYDVDQAMSELLSLRDTPLADSATWDSLELFKPHPLILTA